MRRNRFCLIVLLLVLGLLCTACAAPETEEAANASAEYEDVSAILEEAEKRYQDGAYGDSLEQYLTAMEKNPKDMSARIGVVKCQIKMENYEIADMNLQMARQIQPDAPQISQLYLDLGQASENMAYSRQGVELANQYGHGEVLERAPEAPVIDREAGSYSERILLSVACDDPDAQVYVSLENRQNSSYGLNDVRYTQPITLIRGENTVSVYSVKDGVPSETVSKTYSIQYDSCEISFREPLMEELVRQSVGKPVGPITNYDCEQVTEINWYNLQNIYSEQELYESLKIHSLEDLQYLPGLMYLNLQFQTEIEDFSPLRYCPLMVQIMAYECDLRNTDFVKYVPNISYLTLDNNNISDVSAMEELTGLYGLYIYGNDENIKIDQILRNNKNIDSLSIDDTNLSDYNVLAELENLVYLDIYGISYIDYEALGQLTKLVSLQMSHNYARQEYYGAEIGDISFLPKLQELELLILNGVSKVSDLAYINQLPNLTSLYLYNCEATQDQAAMKALMEAHPTCAIYY